MEDNVLPSPAVAEILNEHYVEARLFTDTEENIERILELQAVLAGTVANPAFVLVDPKAGQKLYQLQGKRSERTFARFLEAGLRRAEDEVALFR
jgi:hypothetical protein